MKDRKRFGVLVLAAGSSSRLGSPKQLLSYQHKTLLSITIDAAKKVAQSSVVVILGGNYDLIVPKVDLSTIHVVYNTDWEEGMSSSIRLGMSNLLAAEEFLDGVILTVCDQPFITDKVFKALIVEEKSSGKTIVASAYAETLGVPVLFDRKYFGDLTRLTGKQGAKTLLMKYRDEVASVSFEQGAVDIDTWSDYNKLLDS